MSIEISHDKTATREAIPPTIVSEKKRLDELVDQAILKDGVDLTNCDREPIHTSNAVQPHGALLVFEPQTLKILQYSENLIQWTGLSHAAIREGDLHLFLSPENINSIRRLLDDQPVSHRRQVNLRLLHSLQDDSKICAGQLMIESAYCCLELEPIDHEILGYFDFHQQLKAPIKRIQSLQSFESLCDQVVHEIKNMTGHDRVLIYEFHPDNTGSVIAEAVNEDMSPFMGLRFPATDIPLQARILYTINLLRIIPNVSYQPVPLVNCGPSLPYDVLDLSMVGVRSVSPIHLEYLQNMGVGASFSISVLRDNKLWGLIACHHNTPKNIPVNTRLCCEFIAQILSSELVLKEKNDVLSGKHHQQLLLQKICSDMLESESLAELFQHRYFDIMQIVDATGIALIEDSHIASFGTVPSANEITILYQKIEAEYHQRMIFSSDSLRDFCPELESTVSGIAGFLGLLISRPHKIAVIWFRPELNQSIQWAGNPNKPEEINAQGERVLSPRQSFALWEETVQGHSRPWSDTDLDSVDQMRNGMVGIFLKNLSDLSALNLALSQSNDDLRSLAYAASHDLKSPLRSISHLAHWLREDLHEHLDTETGGYIQEILDSVTRMNAVIGALLKFFEAGTICDELETLSITQLLRNVLKYVSPPPAFEITYPTDHRQYTLNTRLLSQVLINLIDNACKYIDRPDGKITIDFYLEDHQIVFEVKDNGPGIAPALHDKIFEMFSALERDRGTGMGLAIVKKLIQKQGGQLKLISALGEGCNFKFSWPLDTESES